MRRPLAITTRALARTALCALLASPAAAEDAPEGPRIPFHESELTVGIGGVRVQGSARRETGVSYASLLGPGTMGVIGFRTHFNLRRGERWALALGPALQFDHTAFRGSDDVDDGGRTLVSGGLTMQRYLLGGGLKLALGRPEDPTRFWIGPQLLVGLVHTSDSPIRSRTAPPMIQLSAGTLFEDDFAFALDASVRLGFAFRVASHVEVVLGATFGVGWQEAPRVGNPGLLPSDRADAMVPLHATASITIVFERSAPRAPEE